MDQPYFRSYIRRYACSPEEIRNALKFTPAKGMSGDEDSDRSYDEAANYLDSSYESELIPVNESAIRRSEVDRGSQEVFIPKRCPEDVGKGYCYNGGECFADYQTEHHMVTFCRCAPGWHGRQCQYYFNPKLYESARIGPEVESMAFSSMLVIVLIAVLVVSGLLYFSRTFCKTRDLRDLIWFDASGLSPDNLTPLQLYPFSRRTTSLPLSSTASSIAHGPATISTSGSPVFTASHPPSATPSAAYSRRVSDSDEPMLPATSPTSRKFSHFGAHPLASSTLASVPHYISDSTPSTPGPSPPRRPELSVIEFL